MSGNPEEPLGGVRGVVEHRWNIGHLARACQPTTGGLQERVRVEAQPGLVSPASGVHPLMEGGGGRAKEREVRVGQSGPVWRS